MRECGLAELLPSLDTVWVGLSGGSMVMCPASASTSSAGSLRAAATRALGLVGFSIFPHLDHEEMPWNSLAKAEEWAAGMPGPAYAIDDETAIKVVDDAVEVVSEGNWKLFGG